MLLFMGPPLSLFLFREIGIGIGIDIGNNQSKRATGSSRCSLPMDLPFASSWAPARWLLLAKF